LLFIVDFADGLLSVLRFESELTLLIHPTPYSLVFTTRLLQDTDDILTMSASIVKELDKFQKSAERNRRAYKDSIGDRNLLELWDAASQNVKALEKDLEAELGTKPIKIEDDDEKEENKYIINLIAERNRRAYEDSIGDNGVGDRNLLELWDAATHYVKALEKDLEVELATKPIKKEDDDEADSNVAKREGRNQDFASDASLEQKNKSVTKMPRSVKDEEVSATLATGFSQGAPMKSVVTAAMTGGPGHDAATAPEKFTLGADTTFEQVRAYLRERKALPMDAAGIDGATNTVLIQIIKVLDEKKFFAEHRKICPDCFKKRNAGKRQLKQETGIKLKQYYLKLLFCDVSNTGCAA